MIKEFQYFLARINENLAIEEIEEPELSINAKDYLETWECTLKDRYRNIKTGELKRLKEIFEAPSRYHTSSNKYLGVFNKDGEFKVINFGYEWYANRRGHNRVANPFKAVELTFKDISYKKGGEYYDVFIGPEFQKIEYKKSGKGRYYKSKNTNHVLIEKQRFTVCNLFKYFYDLRWNFSGRRVEVIHKDAWHGDEDKKNFRVPTWRLYDVDRESLTINHYRDSHFHFDISILGRGNVSYTVDVFDPIIAKKTFRYINPVEDPYGEEDWGEYFSERIRNR